MTSESWRQQLEARFAACRTDAESLQAIEEDLKHLAVPWAGVLRLRVIHARLHLKTNAIAVKTPEWCARFGLPATLRSNNSETSTPWEFSHEGAQGSSRSCPCSTHQLMPRQAPP